ncbi:hypothetical protein D9M73_237540 [compost metagenome]
MYQAASGERGQTMFTMAHRPYTSAARLTQIPQAPRVNWPFGRQPLARAISAATTINWKAM